MYLVALLASVLDAVACMQLHNGWCVRVACMCVCVWGGGLRFIMITSNSCQLFMSCMHALYCRRMRNRRRQQAPISHA